MGKKLVRPGERLYIPLDKENDQYIYGTLGAFARYCSPEGNFIMGIISAAHVFEQAGNSEIFIRGGEEGTQIQLAKPDGFFISNDAIYFKEIVTDEIEIDPMFSNLEQPEYGIEIYKIGGTINYEVKALISPMPIADYYYAISNNNSELSLGGDSGAPWYYKSKSGNLNLVGFHIAGNDENLNPNKEFAIFCSAYRNFESLSLELLTLNQKIDMKDEYKFTDDTGTEVIVDPKELDDEAKKTGQFKVKTKDGKISTISKEHAKELIKSQLYDYLPEEVKSQLEFGGGGP